MYGIYGILREIYDFKRTKTTGLIGFLKVGGEMFIFLSSILL